IPGIRMGKLLRKIADEIPRFPFAKASIVVLDPEREDAVIRAGATIADLSDEVPVVGGKRDSLGALKDLQLRLPERRIQSVPMSERSENNTIVISLLQRLEPFEHFGSEQFTLH